MDPLAPRVIDLGLMCYPDAYVVQTQHVDEVLAARASGRPDAGRILLVEHPPVVTVSRRPGAARHLLADTAKLASLGVVVEPTDRGGDITYHGPGQLVVYPILDLNALGLRMIEYLRLLEACAMDVCARFGVPTRLVPGATGVWVDRAESGERGSSDAALGAPQPAKIAAIGVRVKRWVSMHGMAMNVTTNLAHFELIVPCGLGNRSVTSLESELGPACPTMSAVKQAVADVLMKRTMAARQNEAA
ncbi:MAG: lipoyl(octanoyl) transferase LipB [Phycisphaerae bacterium]|nr:lipoyl(octanoyl) transferase LipB [Phycisphaerae bacterium]